MDRTNWKWGKSNINILMVGVAYKGSAIPLFWEMLDKQGNSNTEERIQIISLFIRVFGKERIKTLLCDREFVGKEWFAWLRKEHIPFHVRIKQNTIATNSKGEGIQIKHLFHDLQIGEKRVLKGRRRIFGKAMYLAALRLTDGDLLIVATSVDAETAIETYALRWEIETLFGCLKGRGFNFEDTHITDPEKIKKMVAVLAIGFCWSHKTGEWRAEEKPIHIKKHGRLATSLFRYGLDALANILCPIGICMKSKVRELKILWERLVNPLEECGFYYVA